MHMWSHHVWRCDGGFSLARCHHECIWFSISLSLSSFYHKRLRSHARTIYVHRCMYVHTP